MKCSACGWNNLASYQRCFSCDAPLAPSAPEAKRAPKPTTVPPASPSASPPAGRPGATPAKTRQARDVGHIPDDAVLASKVTRVVAAAFDLLLMGVTGVLAFTLTMALLGARAWGEWTWVPIALAVLLVTASVLLPALMDTYSAGSPAKRLFNLRVINADGERPGIARSIVRHILKHVLHFVMPLALILIEKIFFGSVATHDRLMNTRVIDRRASPAQVAQVVATAFQPTALGNLFKIVVAAGLVGATLFIGAVAALVATSKPNPTREAVSALAGTAKLLAKQNENHFNANGVFPAALSDLGLAVLPNEFSAVQFNATSGTFILTISDSASESLRGKTLTLYPEFKRKKGGSKLQKWRCGSRDIPVDDRPFGCKDEVAHLR